MPGKLSPDIQDNEKNKFGEDGSENVGINALRAPSLFSHIDAPGTFLVKSGKGVLNRLVINDKGIGASSIEIFNSLVGSGDLIASLDTNDIFGPVEYGIAFDLGLTLVVAGGNVDITVGYL